MKAQKLHQWFFATSLILLSSAAISQTPGTVKKVMTRTENQTNNTNNGNVGTSTPGNTWPDGSVHYPDGTIRYPDGRVIHPDNGVRRNDGTVLFPDGRVAYPDGRVIYPNNRRRNYSNLPPGQAKKLYGDKSAKAYAPGQRKKAKNYNNDDGHHKNKSHKPKKNK